MEDYLNLELCTEGRSWENDPKGKEGRVQYLDGGSEDKTCEKKIFLQKKKNSQPGDRRIKVLFGYNPIVQIINRVFIKHTNVFNTTTGTSFIVIKQGEM